MACGAIERPLVFAGNDKPGVMLSNAIGQYVNRYAVAPGQRALFCVNNDAAYAAALALARAGSQVQVADLRSEPHPDIQSAARAAGNGGFLKPRGIAAGQMQHHAGRGAGFRQGAAQAG